MNMESQKYHAGTLQGLLGLKNFLGIEIVEGKIILTTTDRLSEWEVGYLIEPCYTLVRQVYIYIDEPVELWESNYTHVEYEIEIASAK
jgi:hypothetical protein